MSSPFPGMDPYLEMYWRDVHTALMVYARDQIQDQLPRDLLARVEEGVTIDLGEEVRGAAPDVEVLEQTQPQSQSWGGESSGSPVATAVETATAAEPVVVAVNVPHTERHIVILDRSSGDRLVTAIEFLSPSNKTPGEQQERYRRKQRDFLTGGVNLVEVDLIRSGVFTLAVPQENIPREFRTLYQVCVRRATRPGEAEVYRIPLREQLPTIRIPLRRDDRDVLLNLQELIDQCYQRGRYDAAIDYSADPIPPLSPADAQWADELLRGAGRRKQRRDK